MGIGWSRCRLQCRGWSGPGYGGPVRETPEELNELQALLDASLSRSTTHLRSIITGRTLTAEQLTQILTGMCTLALSTVTAKG